MITVKIPASCPSCFSEISTVERSYQKKEKNKNSVETLGRKVMNSYLKLLHTPRDTNTNDNRGKEEIKAETIPDSAERIPVQWEESSEESRWL